MAGFCLLFFALGIVIFNQKAERINNFTENRSFSGTVEIVKDPEIKDWNQAIVAETSESYKILIFTDKYSEYSYGDKFKLECNLEIPKNKEDSRFDYKTYLAKDEIFYLCQKPRIEKIAGVNKKTFYGFLLNIRKSMSTKIGRLVPYPEFGLLEGLLLGGSAGLPKKLQTDFSRTGTTHIVAVSGYNVTIVAEYLMIACIFFGLWRGQAFWAALLGIFLFIFLVGFPPSAVRAGVMGGLILWAVKEGRLGNSENAILFAASVMLIFNPMLLRFDIGFQLSFLATLGIIYVYPFFNNFLVKKQKHLGFAWEILFLTLAAQIFVLPVILYNFENLSVISPLANVLVLPIIPLTMLLGFLTLIFSFIFYPLAAIFSWLTFLPLKYETFIISFLSGFNFSSLKFSFPWWGAVIWYLVLGVLFYIMNNRLRNNDF
jgi:competence protein ComEC